MTNEEVDRILKTLTCKRDGDPGSHPDALNRIAKEHIRLKELQKMVAELNKSFDTVRIVIKYLMFDLEATRRERDHFRMLLEDRD